MATNVIQDESDLVEAIMGLPFGKLMAVAAELVRMNEDKDFARDVNSPLGMATTLYDWGEAISSDDE